MNVGDCYLIEQPNEDGVAAIKIIKQNNRLLAESVDIIRLSNDKWAIAYNTYDLSFIEMLLQRYFIRDLIEKEWNEFKKLYNFLNFLNIKDSTKNIRLRKQIKIKEGFYIKRTSFMNAISEEYIKVKLMNDNNFTIEKIESSKTDDNLIVYINRNRKKDRATVIKNIETILITSNIGRITWYKKVRENNISNLVINKLVNL